jgi:hypothetical protein
VPRRAINLMEALRRSIAEDKKAEVPRPAGAGPQEGVSLITLHWRSRGAGAIGGARPVTTFLRAA